MAPKVDLTQLGTTGLKRSGGTVIEEFLPQLWGQNGIRVWREMADNEPVVGSFLLAIEKIIQRLEWRFDPFTDDSADGEPQPADVETAVFFEGCLNDMSESWDDTLSQILSMIPFGWSWHEVMFKRCLGPDQTDPTKRSKYTDGKIRWRRFEPRAQDTLFQWEFAEDGGIVAMHQMDPYSNRGVVPIPIVKSLLFRTSSAKGNPEGRSMLRNAYRPWWFKRRIEEYEAIGVERDLAGLPVAYVPPELLAANPSPTDAAVLAAVKAIVTGIKRNESEGVIFPQHFDERGNKTYDLTLMSSGGQRQFDTDKIVTRYDQRIAMSVLSDFILLGHERVGSFSLGATKMDLFTMAIDAIASGIASVVNQHAVPRLMRLNGMDTQRPPRLAYSEVSNIDLAELGTFVSTLVTAGAIAPDPTMEDYLREVGGLPPANHGVDDAGADQMSPEDLKAVMALPPAQRLVAQRTGVIPDPPPMPGMNPPIPAKGGDKGRPGAQPFPQPAKGK